MILPLALLLAALQSAVPASPPYYYCEVSRQVPFGNVTVLQYVNMAGPSEAPTTSWFADRGAGGTVLMAVWGTRAQMADPGEGGEIFFGYRPPDPNAQYRVEVAAIDGAGASGPPLSSALHQASRNGLVGLRTHWGPVTALLAAGARLEVRVVRPDGAVIRLDRIDTAEFGRALRLAGEIQPAFAAKAANYREHCRPTNSNGRR